MDAAESTSPDQTANPAEKTPASQPFDFRHPVFLSSGEWRKLRMEADEFVESLGALLSTYFRLELGMQVGKLQTLPFNELTSLLPASTQLSLFKLDPLRGISFMEVRPKLAHTMVDRLLGGPGQPPETPRNLTDMEVALLDQVVQIILTEWCKQWKKLQDLRPEILGHENSPKFLQTSSGDTMMLSLTLDVRMAESTDQLQLVFPYSTLEPLVKKLTASAAPAPAPVAATPPSIKWNSSLDNVPVNIVAQWPKLKISTRELLGLKVGEILELKPQMSEAIELKIGALTKFKGRLGTRENKWTVQISEILKPS